nr:zinc-dependent metalloprotease [Enterococcus faecalis]
DAFAKQLGELGGLEQLGGTGPLGAMGGTLGDPSAMMKKMGGTMFGLQFGHAIGSIAREAIGVTDLSLPLWTFYAPVIVPANL